MSTLSHYHVQIIKFSTRKTRFKPNRKKIYLQILVTLRTSISSITKPMRAQKELMQSHLVMEIQKHFSVGQARYLEGNAHRKILSIHWGEPERAPHKRYSCA